MVDHISQTPAKTVQPDINANKIIFEKGIETRQPLTVYIEKQEICQKFSIQAGLPITNMEMHMTRTKAAIQCGTHFKDNWEAWNRIANKTWAA